MVDIRNQIYTDIESQFPAIYREEGELFVAFVEAYYEYIDLRANNFRDAVIIRDVDTTFDRFLDYFKNKHLKDFPIPQTLDTRFLIKHIQDLYRRKGTEESIRLLFRIFFDEEIEVFYPSTSILKPSDSKYGANTYLEFKRVNTYRDYVVKRGDRIRGSTSKATAFVDELLFLTIEGVIVPVAYLSNLNGTFVADDAIEIYRQGITDAILPGKIVYGSMDSLTIDRGSGRIPNNKVGDLVNINSNLYGCKATGIVTAVSETASGVIEFSIDEGGWGYSTNQALNTLTISNQVLVLEDSSSVPVSALDSIESSNSSVSPIDPNSNTVFQETFSGIGTVVKYEHPLIYLKANANTAFNLLPFGGKSEVYLNGDANTALTVVNVSQFNDSAVFEVAELAEVETVTIITDVIGDFESLALDVANYGMSGSGIQTIDTTLRDAFTPLTLEIGEISKLKILDEGVDYQNDVKCIITQSEIVKFDKKDIGIIFDRTDFIITKGDSITQVIEIEDLTYQSNTVPYTVKADFIRREGDVFYFRKKSFFDFDNDLPVNIKNNQYSIVGFTEDVNSNSIGNNAEINGRALFALGQIESVKILETGFRYRDGEEVEIQNANGVVAAKGNITVKGQGKTQAKWKTTTSFLNDSTKVIRDNYYYQEYSYDISSILNPDLYTKLTNDTVQVAGTIQFSSPLINSVNDFQPSVDMALEIFDTSEVAIGVESNNVIVDTLGATANNAIIGDLVAVIEALDEDGYQVSLGE